MDRDALERMLGDGLSLAEIGRRLDRHESTVAYWLAKYELQAIGHERHAPKGPLPRDELAALVAAGLSSSEIAEKVGRTRTTVRYWLREYGMTTAWAARRQASREGVWELTLSCPRHGLTTFRRRRAGGYRCAKCRTEAVSRRRRRVKRILAEEAGGACRLCGYSRCMAALEFHHVAPDLKRFSLSHRGVARSIERARAEASKCVLLCANCHAEVEAGVTKLPSADALLTMCAPETASPG
jgi:transposase